MRLLFNLENISFKKNLILKLWTLTTYLLICLFIAEVYLFCKVLKSESTRLFCFLKVAMSNSYIRRVKAQFENTFLKWYLWKQINSQVKERSKIFLCNWTYTLDSLDVGGCQIFAKQLSLLGCSMSSKFAQNHHTECMKNLTNFTNLQTKSFYIWSKLIAFHVVTFFQTKLKMKFSLIR